MPNKNNRLGIAGTIYHQVAGSNPTSSSLRCTMLIKTSEESFSRTPPKPLTKSWLKLNLGWLPKCSLLCIKNLEDVGGHTIQIGFLDVQLPLIIPPKMVTLLYPESHLSLRCITGEAHYSLFAVPE